MEVGDYEGYMGEHQVRVLPFELFLSSSVH